MLTFIHRMTLPLLVLAGWGAAQAAPEPVAVYQFANSLSSSVAGAPALQVVDPLGRGGFAVDVVNGSPTVVYNFGGDNFPTTSQGGLTLDVSSILAGHADQYSVEVVFKFNDNDGRWRRIIDVQNRQSDNGFYVDPGNRLNIYPVSSGNAFSTGVYHDVFLVNDQGKATYYLDNGAATVSNTAVMNIDASGRMNFFLDNVVAGGQGEYASGSVALIRIYDSALSAPPPPIPEPATWALLIGGLGALTARARRRAS